MPTVGLALLCRIAGRELLLLPFQGRACHKDNKKCEIIYLCREINGDRDSLFYEYEIFNFCGVGANMMVGGCDKLLYFRIFVMTHDEVQSF